MNHDYDVCVIGSGAGGGPIAYELSKAGKSVVVFSDANGKLYLTDDGTADTLDAVASVAGDLVATISYIERT